MKRIILSLAVIAVVAVVAVGATRAFFSDTETSTGNTFSTGTINIDVNGGVWEASNPYTIKDMKPGYTDYTNFTINNPGSNPVNVWKKITGMVTTGGDGVRNGELKNAIVYDLSVKVYRKDDTAPFWFTTIYSDSDGKTLNNVYGSLQDGKGILLGMIPEGGKMEVTQSYHMAESAGNEYQGLTMTFDMSLYAEQLTNTVTMVQKTGADTDTYKQTTVNTINATLTYGVKADAFNYNFSAKGLTPSTNYVLVSGTNPYNGTDNQVIKTFMTDGSGNYTVTGQSVDFNADLTNAKTWVITAVDWNNITKKMVGPWNPANYLFETALMDYTDPIH